MSTQIETRPEFRAELPPRSAAQGPGNEPRVAFTAASPEDSNLISLTNHRILVVDDNPAIHEDFRKVLCGKNRPQAALLEAEAALFGKSDEFFPAADFELDSAHQGQEALEKVKQSLAVGRPYAMAFVDVRMPPGWDGIETISRLWQVYPELQVIICTAYSDYSWDEMVRKLGTRDNLVILKKPFDNVEVLQLAYAFIRKWGLNCQARLKLSELKEMVTLRTRELEQANQELRREMQERIQTERQLRQAQKMEAIGQLAAGIAHDFNNILTVVHGHASMLSMRLGEQGPHAKSIAEIRQSAERAAELVRQLLMFSRKQVLQFRNVDVGEVIFSVSSMLRQLVGEHIQFQTECTPRLPAIYADRGMIEQTIVNLTINARDAMPRGGRLTVGVRSVSLDERTARTHPEARPGQYVCLTVADTGCGMDAETLGHLFEPFFTTKEIGKGTGLGLATVYGIVKQHRGWVEVESRPNVGTTFQIHFPVTDQTAQPPVKAQEQPPQCRGSETILLAEDEGPLREMVAEILGLQGYRVLVASSGPAAMALWHQEKAAVHLLLTDIIMPGGMMGTDLAAELKRSNPNLKVIFTTGYSPGMAGAQASLQEGINFLPKPYAPGKLSEMVRNCLDTVKA